MAATYPTVLHCRLNRATAEYLVTQFNISGNIGCFIQPLQKSPKLRQAGAYCKDSVKLRLLSDWCLKARSIVLPIDVCVILRLPSSDFEIKAFNQDI